MWECLRISSNDNNLSPTKPQAPWKIILGQWKIRQELSRVEEKGRGIEPTMQTVAKDQAGSLRYVPLVVEYGETFEIIVISQVVVWWLKRHYYIRKSLYIRETNKAHLQRTLKATS